jgi:hypothetical protein
MPLAAVAIDQIATPPNITQRRLCRSTSTPASRPNSAKVSEKPKPFSMPNCTSLSPRSRFIGPTSREMMKRSNIDTQ